jgi:hypothetical protein
VRKGVFIHPAFCQDAGIDQVYEQVARGGIDAVCLTPNIAVADPGGTRVPPLHGDGHRRVLNQPLWGKHELYLRFSPAHRPEASLFPEKYPSPESLSDHPDAHVPADMVREAQVRGWEAHLLVQPLRVPGLQPSERRVLFNGEAWPGMEPGLGCPSNPLVLRYGLALIEDTLRAHPSIDGMLLDWAEYPCYCMEDFFTCFCEWCSKRATEEGLDPTELAGDAAALWQLLADLSEEQLDRATRPGWSSVMTLLAWLLDRPGMLQLLELKGEVVAGFHREIRCLLDQMGHQHVKLSTRVWPIPWSLASGAHVSRLAPWCDTISPKLFLFDLAAVPGWYCSALRRINPRVSERTALAFILALLGLRPVEAVEPERFVVPGPSDRHPISLDTYRAKVAKPQTFPEGRTAWIPSLHSYLPEDQWDELLQVVSPDAVDGIWVHMYGYLSERKLQALAAWGSQPGGAGESG